MKFFKYIAILAIGVFTLSSCSDDNNDYSVNTASGVGVSVESSEMIVNEAQNLINIPLVVTGNPNGYVKVNVKVIGTDDPDQEQAIADSHFYVTSTHVNIPADTKTASVQIRLQNSEERDPDRYFRIVIDKAEGATIEPLNTCTVMIQDRKSSPIYALSGKWSLAFNDYDGVKVETPNARLEVINSETGQCKFKPFYPSLYSELELEVLLRPDDVTGEYIMSIPLGTTAAEGLQFTGLGECSVIVTDTNRNDSGSIVGTWNDDNTVVTFQDGIALCVFSEGVNKGFWDILTNLVFTKLPD